MTHANDALLYAMSRFYAMRNRDEEGASAAEYCLMLALIAVVATGALTTVGPNVKMKVRAVAENLK